MDEGREWWNFCRPWSMMIPALLFLSVLIASRVTFAPFPLYWLRTKRKLAAVSLESSSWRSPPLTSIDSVPSIEHWASGSGDVFWIPGWLYWYSASIPMGKFKSTVKSLTMPALRGGRVWISYWTVYLLVIACCLLGWRFLATKVRQNTSGSSRVPLFRNRHWLERVHYLQVGRLQRPDLRILWINQSWCKHRFPLDGGSPVTAVG